MKISTTTRAQLIGLGAGLLAAVALAAAPSPAHAATSTIVVPDDFVPALSDTRATGHYELTPAGLRLYTEGATSTDKVAEYVTSGAPLASVGEPSLVWTGSAPAPGFQMVVDFDADGTADGILVGEAVYAGDWWASNGSAQFVKDGAPSHTGGSGSANHGTLEQWRAAFPTAVVTHFGFSLGSGVLGDGVLSSLTIGGTVHTFSAPLPPLPECGPGEEAIPAGETGYVCGPADPATPEDVDKGEVVPVTETAPAVTTPPAMLAETGFGDRGTLIALWLAVGVVMFGGGLLWIAVDRARYAARYRRIGRAIDSAARGDFDDHS